MRDGRACSLLRRRRWRRSKGRRGVPIEPGDVIVLAGCGPAGTGMEETYQLTSALKHLPWGKQVALVTDARFSGVSTGSVHRACRAPRRSPAGRLARCSMTTGLRSTLICGGPRVGWSLVGHGDERRDAAWGAAELARRPMRDDLAEAAELPADTRLWAALQAVGGGTWGGCVYDVEGIVERLRG